MKVLLILTTVLLLQLNLIAEDTTLVFRNTSYSEVFKLAKKEHKNVLLYFHFYGCGACLKMEKNAFADKQVITFFDQNYICLKLNTREGEGIEISKTYNVRINPAFIFLDEGGKILHRIVGVYQPDEFLAQARNAISPANSLSYSKEQYKKGNRDADFLFDYCYKLRDASELDSLVVNEYLETQSLNDLAKEKNLKFIYEFAIHRRQMYIAFDSRVYQFIKSNRELFSPFFDPVQVDTRLMYITQSEVYRSIKMKDEAAFYKALEVLKTYDTGQEYNFKEMNGGISMWINRRSLVLRAEMAFYETNGDIAGYNATLDSLLIKIWDDSEALNMFAWRYYQKYDDTSKIEKAVECVKRSIELNSNYANNDTYAALLYKQGKYELAIKQAEKAIELAKEENVDFGETSRLMQLIQEKQKK